MKGVAAGAGDGIGHVAGASPELRRKTTGRNPILLHELGTEEGEHRFAVGKKNAAILARLPNVGKRTQPEIHLQPAGDRKFYFVNLLCLIVFGSDAEAVEAWRKRWQCVESPAVRPGCRLH